MIEKNTYEAELDNYRKQKQDFEFQKSILHSEYLKKDEME